MAALNELSSENTRVKPFGRPVEWTKERIDQEADALEEWLKDPNNYYANNFFCDRGISRQHVQPFCEKSVHFSDTWRKAKEIQEQRLINLAVTRKGDPGFIKFMLVSKGGWKDESTVNHNLNPLASLLDKIASVDNQAITVEPIEEQSPAQIQHSDGVIANPILPNR